MTILAPIFLAALTLFPSTLAQRPANTTICDYYSKTLLGEQTPASQKRLLTILMNTVVIGNYTTPSTGKPVHGIAGPGVQDGTPVDLLPFFTGAKLTTTGPDPNANVGISKLFLDDGGGVPLGMNISSNGTSSTQFLLLNHIWQYFGNLLECSEQGKTDIFKAYEGEEDMYKLHRFMDISKAQNDFFIQQLVDSSLRLGFSDADAQNWRTLMAPFNNRCEPPILTKNLGTYLPSVCIAADCRLGPKADCSLYPFKGVAVIPANATVPSASSSASGTASATASGTSSSTAKPSASTSTTVSNGAGVESGSGWQMVLMLGAAVVVASFQI